MAEAFIGPVGYLQQAVYYTLVTPPVTGASSSIAGSFQLPAGAIVGVAAVRITASPAGHATVANVARVRAADNDDGSATANHIVDFGGLRSVTSVSSARFVSSVKPWLGTAFDDESLAGSGLGTEYRFGEIRAERLLVTLATATTPADFAANAGVTINDAPADLELIVAGERAHFVAGAVRGPGATHDETVDVTEAVQRAVDAGISPVPIELRASVPGQLSITPSLQFLSAYHASFAEGERRTVTATDEGVLDVRVPLGSGNASWKIRLVRFELAGVVGDARVVPADGPVFTADAQLTCDPNRSITVRLPPSAVRRFDQVVAIRVPVACEAPAELAGFLRAGVTDALGVPMPGEAIPDATLAPTPVEPKGAIAFVTVPLARPTPVDPAATVWASVQVTRGEVLVPLVETAIPVDEQALVRRQAPNGCFRSLPSVPGVATDAAGLRVVGIAPATAPIAAVEVSVPGAVSTTAADRPTVTATPGTSPEVHELHFTSAPVTVANATARIGDDLVVRLRVTGPGEYTVGPVTIGYEEAS